jgi:uncharacterized protein (DUF433 family)
LVDVTQIARLMTKDSIKNKGALKSPSDSYGGSTKKGLQRDVLPSCCYSEAMEYVDRRGQDYMLSGSRVSLASVVLAWKEGLSPEAIRDDFPTLRLEQVYGAIAYYLANQTEIESYLADLSADFQRRQAEQQALHLEQTAKLRTAIETTQR